MPLVPRGTKKPDSASKADIRRPRGRDAAASGWSPASAPPGVQTNLPGAAGLLSTSPTSGLVPSAALSALAAGGSASGGYYSSPPPPPPPQRQRLYTDGARNERFEASRLLERRFSWDGRRPRRRAPSGFERQGSGLDYDILTRTSFTFEKDHQVHIPTDTDDDDEDSAMERGDRADEGAGGGEGAGWGDAAGADAAGAGVHPGLPVLVGRHVEDLSPLVADPLSPAGLLTEPSPSPSSPSPSPSPSAVPPLAAVPPLLSALSFSSAMSGRSGRSGKSGKSERSRLLGDPDGGSPRLVQSFEHGRSSFSFRKFWLYCGPGWLMSVAYLDPGNIESDLQAGAFHGYQLLWVLTVATTVGLGYQCLAVRLGVVLNKNLAEVCRGHYSSFDRNVLYGMMQLAVIGSDCQELLGSAIAFRVLFGFPLWLGCLLTGVDTFTFLGLQVVGVRKLELFFVMLISVMVLCFVGTFLSQPTDPAAMAHGLFVPYVQPEAKVQAVSILGAVVMPHNIFLHSALVLSRDIDRTRPHRVAEANFYFSLEAALALLVSLLINVAVVAVFAHGFYSGTCAALRAPLALQPGGQVVEAPFACVPRPPLGATGEMAQASAVACVTDGGVEGTCMPIGLQGAALALEAFAGKAAAVVWSVGLLAAGQSSTMTGTYAGQFIMEGFLQLSIPNWVRVAVTRAVSLGPAMAVAVLANSDFLAADKLDENLNVLQSLQLPIALLPLLAFTGSHDYMGAFANGRLVQTLGIAVCLLVVALNGFLVASSLDVSALAPASLALALVFAALYAYIVLRLAKDIFSVVRVPTAESTAEPTVTVGLPRVPHSAKAIAKASAGLGLGEEVWTNGHGHGHGHGNGNGHGNRGGNRGGNGHVARAFKYGAVGVADTDSLGGLD